MVVIPQRRLLLLPEVAIWEIFEFLAGLVIYSSYQVQQTTCLKTFHFLCTYPRKVFSAWTEVWTGTCRSSRRFCFSEVVLGRFSRFWGRARLAISITRQVRRTTVMDHIFAFSHVQSRYLALGPRFGLVLVAQVEGFASRRSFWADFRDSGGGRGWRYQ